MTACIYFHPEGYTTSGRRIMGRHAAGESFLRGFVQDSIDQPKLWVQVEERSHAEEFAAFARGLGCSAEVHVIQRHSLPKLAEPGAIFHPGPGLGRQAWHRSFFGARSWSLCGITHTTCSALAMDAISELALAPLQPWDALICTSEAVRANVQSLLEAQTSYLRDRLGATRFPRPQLPVIPLGVHSDDFGTDETVRAEARRTLDCDEDTLVVLFLGRLAFHAKAHPLALYQALQRAAEDTGKSVLLVECGWHANAAIRDAYQEAARRVSPSVRVLTLDGGDPEQRRCAWAAADIFCSLADNIQETFGITPLEAMAAGLPVVVSDWDGYRDTVRDGIDGFRIPTVMPPPTLGGDLACRHALEIDTYDLYCGYSCAFVAVDVQATAQAFSRLFASADLRRRMGEAGRRRVRETFDWSVILPRYRELWQELADRRQAGTEATPVAIATPSAEPTAPPAWPARLDPFTAFQAYPSVLLGETSELVPALPDLPAALERLDVLMGLGMVNYAEPVLPSREELESVLRLASTGPRTAGELVAPLPEARRALVFRALVWLLKLDLLRLSPAAVCLQA